MAGKFVSKWFYAELGKYEVEVSAGLFKTKKEERASQRYVDFDSYADLLTKGTNGVRSCIDALVI